MDLVGAEAVLRLVEAATRDEVLGAARSLGGELARRLRDLAESLARALARVEAAVDFPDEPDVCRQAAEDLGPVRFETRSLGQQIRRVQAPDTEVVFAGRPNVGKSSLVNALAGRPISIVTEEPGTTRDAVRAEVFLGGMRVALVDTAGLGPEPSACGHRADIEAARVAREKMASAALIVWITDEPGEHPPEDLTGRPLLRVVNKSDLRPARGAEGTSDLAVSALTGEGVEQMAAEVTRRMTERYGPVDGFPVTARQHDAIRRLTRGIEGADQALSDELPELAAIDLRDAIGALSGLLGEDVEADVLDRIFEEFCIGK
jgi:tRNA modification GTPase